jgi:hypothetical protein
MLFKRIILTVGFLLLFFGAVSLLDKAHSEGIDTPACSELSLFIQSDTAEKITAQGGSLLTFTDASVGDVLNTVIETVGSEPPFAVDRIDLAHPTDEAPDVRVLVSYQGCVKAAMVLPYFPFAKYFTKADQK